MNGLGALRLFGGAGIVAIGLAALLLAAWPVLLPVLVALA